MKKEIMQPHEEDLLPVYRTHKDRVFRLLYTKKGRLLELYNALNGTNYEDEAALTVNTLENAIFIKMKNDVSFVIESNMCLYEHQSGYCPNIPLRGFLYLADLYKKYTKDETLSSRSKVWIPTPHYIVFYNGTEREEEEFFQKLSESYEDGGEGCMELTVRVININYGKNRELMERCKSLRDYARFVAMVREKLKSRDMEEAVREAVDECIAKDILREFLMEQKSEVIAMSIYEFDEEKFKKAEREYGYSQGMIDGEQKGNANRLIESVERVMKNLPVELERACAILGTTVEEYQNAKKRFIMTGR